MEYVWTTDKSVRKASDDVRLLKEKPLRTVPFDIVNISPRLQNELAQKLLSTYNCHCQLSVFKTNIEASFQTPDYTTDEYSTTSKFITGLPNIIGRIFFVHVNQRSRVSVQVEGRLKAANQARHDPREDTRIILVSQVQWSNQMLTVTSGFSIAKS